MRFKLNFAPGSRVIRNAFLHRIKQTQGITTMRFLNNNVRSAIHIGLRAVLDNIYRLLCHWNWNNPVASASFMINARREPDHPPMHLLLKKKASWKPWGGEMV